MVNELPEGTDAPADQKRFRVVKEILANQYLKESLRSFLPHTRRLRLGQAPLRAPVEGVWPFCVAGK